MSTSGLRYRTTGVVALKRGRNFIGVELNPKYCDIARRRLSSAAPLFSQEVAADGR